MKIGELQQEVVAILNGVEELVQGGCKAFAEDDRDVYNKADAWIQTGKTALVVVTPDMERNGASAEGIPAETRLIVQASEKPAIARAGRTAMRALDAAELAMHKLDGARFCWQSTRQTIDRQSGVLTATAEFSTTAMLS